MKKNSLMILIAISFISLYFLIHQMLFEIDLKELRSFCEDLKPGISIGQIEAKVRGKSSLSMSPPRISEDGRRYANVYLNRTPRSGWTCGLSLNQDILAERGSFGADHGSKESFLIK